uniref:Secreted protein n=1 Tax=Anopheles melas TaxID=34690 RepID=A0A182TN13_9DIPT
MRGNDTVYATPAGSRKGHVIVAVLLLLLLLLAERAPDGSRNVGRGSHSPRAVVVVVTVVPFEPFVVSAPPPFVWPPPSAAAAAAPSSLAMAEPFSSPVTFMLALLRLLDDDVAVRVQQRRVDQLLLPVGPLHQYHLVVAVAANHLQRFTLAQSLAALHHHADALQQLLDLFRVRALHQYLVALRVRRQDVIVQLQHLPIVQDQVDLLALAALHVLQLHRHVLRVGVLAVLRLLAVIVQAGHADGHALQVLLLLLLLFLLVLIVSLVERWHIDSHGLLLFL